MGNFKRFTFLFWSSITLHRIYFWKLSFCGLAMWLPWIAFADLRPKIDLKLRLSTLFFSTDLQKFRHKYLTSHISMTSWCSFEISTIWQSKCNLLLPSKNHLNLWVFIMRYIVWVFHIFADYSQTVRYCLRPFGEMWTLSMVVAVLCANVFSASNKYI